MRGVAARVASHARLVRSTSQSRPPCVVALLRVALIIAVIAFVIALIILGNPWLLTSQLW